MPEASQLLSLCSLFHTNQWEHVNLDFSLLWQHLHLDKLTDTVLLACESARKLEDRAMLDLFLEGSLVSCTAPCNTLCWRQASQLSFQCISIVLNDHAVNQHPNIHSITMVKCFTYHYLINWITFEISFFIFAKVIFIWCWHWFKDFKDLNVKRKKNWRNS